MLISWQDISFANTTNTLVYYISFFLNAYVLSISRFLRRIYCITPYIVWILINLESTVKYAPYTRCIVSWTLIEGATFKKKRNYLYLHFLHRLLYTGSRKTWSFSNRFRAQCEVQPGWNANPSKNTTAHTLTHSEQFRNANQPTVHVSGLLKKKPELPE